MPDHRNAVHGIDGTYQPTGHSTGDDTDLPDDTTVTPILRGDDPVFCEDLPVPGKCGLPPTARPGDIFRDPYGRPWRVQEDLPGQRFAERAEALSLFRYPPRLPDETQYEWLQRAVPLEEHWLREHDSRGMSWLQYIKGKLESDYTGESTLAEQLRVVQTGGTIASLAAGTILTVAPMKGVETGDPVPRTGVETIVVQPAPKLDRINEQIEKLQDAGDIFEQKDHMEEARDGIGAGQNLNPNQKTPDREPEPSETVLDRVRKRLDRLRSNRNRGLRRS